MSKKWKELDINNLPQDIFKKYYVEVKNVCGDNLWYESKPYTEGDFKSVLGCLKSGQPHRYKEKEQEPEEPIIKKSGGTWVARYEGVDYLMTGQNLTILNYKEIKHLFMANRSKGWEPILILDITDDIALLRPMVNYCEITFPEDGKQTSSNIRNEYILIYSDNNYHIIYNLRSAITKLIPSSTPLSGGQYCRSISLATQSDLED